MTLRLTVDTQAWRRHVDGVVDEIDGLVPVVKGNGYGFGRSELTRTAAELADTVAVGTVHELDVLDITAGRTGATGAALDVVVLTPTLEPPRHHATDPRLILTVGSADHVDRLTGWTGRVLVKVASSMQRYGGGPELLDRARRAGLDVVGWSFHPPLAGSDAHRLDEVSALLPRLDPAHPVWLSHLSTDGYRSLPTTHRYRLRLGTRLWHGDKSMLHLTAEVLATRSVDAGRRVGYRQVEVPVGGTLVMISAGSAHGVAPLADGRSPFHHRQRRLQLVEPPHMHTSMAIVAEGEPVPEIGERVDVQRPLITTDVDVVEWA